jgi:hypothetical protein
MASCLQAVAATCDILQKVEKFIWGKSLTMYVPNLISLHTRKKGGYCLTSERMGKYKAILLDNPNVKL